MMTLCYSNFLFFLFVIASYLDRDINDSPFALRNSLPLGTLSVTGWTQ